MRKADREVIKKWAETLTDEDLEKEYYKSVNDCLGSETERMYELGYDIQDIKDRAKHEKYLCEKSGVLEMICIERGIELWKKEQEEGKDE